MRRPRNIYLVRAESQKDIDRLIRALPLGEFLGCSTMPDGIYPVVTAAIRTRTLGLDQLRELCRSIPNGEIMLQTIQPESQYTGERDPSLT